jgi:hypothetical protein
MTLCHKLQQVAEIGLGVSVLNSVDADGSWLNPVT